MNRGPRTRLARDNCRLRETMRPNILLVALPIMTFTAAAVADPRPVRWGEFVTIMQGNTLSGATAAGKTVNLYFLPGGSASYEDGDGARGRGTWQIDKDG